MTTFLNIVENLLREPSERESFLADREGYLPAHGFDDLSPEDLELMLQMASDSFPPALAQHIDPAAGLSSLTEIPVEQVEEWLEPDIGSDSLDLHQISNLDDPEFDIDPIESDGSRHLDALDQNDATTDEDSTSIEDQAAGTTTNGPELDTNDLLDTDELTPSLTTPIDEPAYELNGHAHAEFDDADSHFDADQPTIDDHPVELDDSILDL